MDHYRNVFAKNVRRRRESLGFSQEQLGFETGLDRTYISGIERGVRNPSLDVIVKISMALNTTPSALLAANEIVEG